MPPAVVRLLVEPLFRDQPTVRCLWERIPAESVAMPSYETAFGFVAGQAEAQLVRPRVCDLLLAERDILARAQDERDRRWLESRLGGAAFGIAGFKPGNAPAAAAVWVATPPDLRRFWSWQVLAWLERDGFTPGNATVLLRNDWLKDAGATRPAVAEVWPLIATHPRWRAALRRFDYAEALRLVPRILEDVQARYLTAETQTAAAAALQAERAAWFGSGFRWGRLGRRLNLFMLPDAAAAMNPEFAGETKGVRIEDVAEGDVLKALTSLAAEESETDLKVSLQLAARLYAANRGLPVPAAAEPKP